MDELEQRSMHGQDIDRMVWMYDGSAVAECAVIGIADSFKGEVVIPTLLTA